MARMFMKPAEGRKVRDPISLRHLPDEGAYVPEDTFWLRRKQDGDVVDAIPPADEKPKAAK